MDSHDDQTEMEEAMSDDFDMSCEACELEDQAVDQTLHFCYACDVTLCERCWNIQLQHRRARQGKSTAVHEKANPWIARQIQNILAPPTDEQSYARLCAADESTAWFGIDRGKRSGDPLYLKDSGRYADLMAQTKDENSIRFSWNSDGEHTAATTRDSRTPSLVSFVGQSGAGKSTLINLLVTFKGAIDRGTVSTPVVGINGLDVPTSEDVHLYPDPASVHSSTPMLYADCEGLDGGEREPVSYRFRKANTSPDLSVRSSTTSPVYVSSRELVWASEDASKRTRNFAVANLYPRLLFSFSDAVVFVLKNPRVIEGVFERLIEWASSALESASNQPVLPAAIIVLNATEINADPEVWDVERSTAKLLDSLSATVKENSTFKKFADFWACRDKNIESLEELILCYFSSIEIVRIPATGRPKLLQVQVEKLYDSIERGCNRARERKLSLRMLLSAGDLQSYLSHSFDHFSQTLDEAFDFVRASLSNCPIPLDFGGNILRLALNVMEYKQQAKQRLEARQLFEELARMVASCILLDSVRHEIRGNAERIFPEYLDHIHKALEDFCLHHWPCEFTITVGEYAQRMQHMHVMAFQRNLHVLNQRARCCNVRSGHGKGHQSRKGIVFAAGDYQAAFTYDRYKAEFEQRIFQHLEWLMKLLEDRVRDGADDVSAANEIHREETLRSFYTNVFQEDVLFTHNHSVCLGCLFERPEHTLPCGHMLCKVCVQSYGRTRNDLLVEMHSCPLEINAVPLRQPIAVYLKPDSASSRVLSIDHGGIRSLLQLEILQSLEEELLNLPIACFFDLLVGSGTGSLIALGLTFRGWSVKKCRYHVERIITQAYGKRTGRNLPGVGRLIESASKEKYDSSALDYAVQEAFGDKEPLFGSLDNRATVAASSDVALVGCTLTGTPVVLASYNRRCFESLPYIFRRAEKPADEIKIWETARITMSTPRLFKPYVHEATKHGYTAAPPQYMNPVYIADSERRILKQDLRCPEAPDLLISLGAGVEDDLVVHSCGTSMASDIVTACTCATIARKESKKHLRRHLSPVRCQTTSDNFVHDFPASATSHVRFVRFNPPAIGKLPASDDLKSLESFKENVRHRVDRKEVKALANKLVAALFYFESIGELSQRSGESTSYQLGLIRCRIPNDTSELMTLGKLLRRKSSSAFPRFTIHDNSRAIQVASITNDTTAEMILSSKFSMQPVEIRVAERASPVDIMLVFDNSEACSISGFPRSLAKQSSRANRHRQAMADMRNLHSDASTDRASLRSRSTARSWQPPPRVASPSSFEGISSVNIPSHVPTQRRFESRPRNSGDNTNKAFPHPVGLSRSRSRSRTRYSDGIAQGKQPIAHGSNPQHPALDQYGLARSPNFSSDGFARQTSSTTSRPSRQVSTRGSPNGTSDGATSIHPEDVVRNVKMMSTREEIDPLEMKLMFGEDDGGVVDARADMQRISLDSSSVNSRRSNGSEQRLNNRLRQLEGIIRSKDRIDASRLRDSLKRR